VRGGTRFGSRRTSWDIHRRLPGARRNVESGSYGGAKRHEQLARPIGLSPDSGILEDIGQRLPFEKPYWSGQHPATDDDLNGYPFPFHPLELGEAALKEFFGYQLEGFIDPTLLEPESIPLVKYKRSRSRWKFW
jgi:hypothetical protein